MASRIHLKRLPHPLASRKTGEKRAGEVVREGEEEGVEREKG